MLTKDYLAPQSVPLLGRFIVCPPFVPTTAAVPDKTTPRVYGLGQGHDELVFDIKGYPAHAPWECL